MKVHIESVDQIVEKSTDGRGRLNLGMEYADMEVQVAILKPDSTDE